MKRSFVISILVLVIVDSLWPLSCNAAGSAVQFFTKAYTEGLGRVPDDGAYENYLAYFGNNGCNVSTVSATVTSILNSQEIQNDYSQNNGDLVEAGYRVALNRDADQAGWSANTSALNSGSETWAQFVNNLIGSQEFYSLVNNQICADLHPGNAGYYGWGGGQIFDRSAGYVAPGTFTGTTGDELQQALNNTPSGSTVFLNQGALITLNSTLVIPAGVILATYGYPPPTQYLRMARLLRGSAFTGSMIGILPGGELAYTWVDGNNANFTNQQIYCPGGTKECLSVSTYGGDGTYVIYNRLSDSFGWTNLQARGSYSDVSCGTNQAMLIDHNLSTQYASSHFMSDAPGETSGPWADGMSVECDNSQVSNNQIVDATDAGIVLFAAGQANQSSTVIANTIIASGNPAFGAIFLDTRGVQTGGSEYTCHAAEGDTYGFYGAMVTQNEIFTSTTSYFGIGISAGVQPDTFPACYGTNATISQNSTHGHIMRTDVGIAISGMLSATITGNSFNLQVGQFNNCPAGNVVADPDLSTDLNIDVPYSYGQLKGCVGSDN